MSLAEHRSPARGCFKINQMQIHAAGAAGAIWDAVPVCRIPRRKVTSHTAAAFSARAALTAKHPSP